MRLVLAAALLAASGAGAAAEGVDGVWLTEGGLSRVRVAPCGSARCGTILSTVRESSDVNNPDPAQKGRPLVGLRLMSDARPSGETWTGRLYNPLDGRTYAGKMRMLGPDRLELSGCVLGGLLCKAQVWTRTR